MLYTGRREFARTIFTTNFDPMLQTSLQLFQLLYYMTDRPEFLSADALQTDAHPVMHLFYAHGSVHRPYMANTDEQIRLLKQHNARDLAAYLGSHGVIVLGYSGWDDCLLEALNQTQTFSNNLYWLARGESSISESVARFLSTHHNAYWAQIDDGGSFMADLHSRLCPGAPNTEMLYNPIHPLLRQLRCVNLSGIQSGGAKDEKDADKSASTSDAPQDVETIRVQVIARLVDAQKLFIEPSKAGTDWEELERQADLSYANGDWEAASNAYNTLLDEHGKSRNLPVERKALALFRRGYCHTQKEEVDSAIADYNAVIGLPGVSAERIARTLINRAFCFWQKKRVDEAIADYAAIIELPGAPVEQISSALFSRGVIYGRKGVVDNAIADYTAVIELPGASAERIARARVNRSSIYIQKEEVDKAIADCTAVIELHGAPVEQIAKARINRGICYKKRNEMDKAIADYTAVIDMAGTPSDLVRRAKTLRSQCLANPSPHAR